MFDCGGIVLVVLNVVNEEVVFVFLVGNLCFVDIFVIIEWILVKIVV